MVKFDSFIELINEGYDDETIVKYMQEAGVSKITVKYVKEFREKAVKLGLVGKTGSSGSVMSNPVLFYNSSQAKEAILKHYKKEDSNE